MSDTSEEQNVTPNTVVPPVQGRDVNVQNVIHGVQTRLRDFISDEDINGECFILGSEGEIEEIRNERVVVLPNTNIINATVPLVLSDPVHQNWFVDFAKLNYHHQVNLNVPNEVAIKVTYLRMLAMREKFFQPFDTSDEHRCRYSEFAYNDRVDIEIPNWNSPNMVAWKKKVRLQFVNIVCILAYFFRVRGHHWTEEMDQRYSEVWRKCLYEEDNPGLAWQYIAHNALHAIYPDKLDSIWIDAVQGGRCAGALIKRISSYPAGIAGISALLAGVADLTLVVPRAFDHMPDAVNHLNVLESQVNASRWAGSVNRRFYDADSIIVNEKLLGGLAALIMASTRQFAERSPLLKSKALERIANNAPMTGAVVARMVRTAVNSDEAGKTFLPQLPER